MNDHVSEFRQAGVGALALSDSLGALRRVITVSSSHSLPDLATATVDALFSHPDVDGCSVFIRKSARADHGPAKEIRQVKGIPETVGIWLLTDVFPAMLTGSGVYREPFMSRRAKEWQGCILALPIGRGDGILGNLAIWSEHSNHFLAWHETLLEMIAGVLSLALPQHIDPRQSISDQPAEVEAFDTTTFSTRSAAFAAGTNCRVSDSLTGLFDRRTFEIRLKALSSISNICSRSCFILYLDIDRFRLIREYGGQTTADRLLRTLAEILKRETENDLDLGKMDTDQFGMIVKGYSLEQVIERATALVDQVEEFRMTFTGRRYHVSISIGVAELDVRLNSGITTLRRAKQACRAAQAVGGGTVQVYHERLADRYRAGNDGWMLNRLTHALKNDGLELYGQLISPLDSNPGNRLPTMYELLLRLRKEEGEICSATSFLPAAERYGLSVKLDRWVIQSAFRQIVASPFAGSDRHRFALNLSGHSIDNYIFLDFIIEQFESTGLSPERICFEITETAAISDIATAKKFIKALRKIGCQFALDDFGSGHSSFLYLRDFPVDYLKIDGQLVREIVSDPVSLAFVRTIEGVGRLMGRRTIAEYVQSQEIYEAIAAIGCDYAQGYWVDDPLPLAEVLSRSMD